MNNDLIERLKEQRDKMDAAVFSHICKLFDEAIAALSPVLPEDVQEIHNQLEQVSVFLVNRSPVASGEELSLSKFCDEARNLIERQEITICTLTERFDAKLQRIEELAELHQSVSESLSVQVSRAARAEAQIAEYEKLAEDAADRLKEVNEGMAATVVITELERIRGMK